MGEIEEITEETGEREDIGMGELYRETGRQVGEGVGVGWAVAVKS